MLIEFRVENHRSLRDEVVLTMEAGRGGDDDDPRAREVPGHSARLLTAAALYGANASGKSNVLDGFAFMRTAVLLSHRVWPPNGGVPRTPFAWGGSGAETMCEVSFLAGGVRYQYGFVCDDSRFLEEWLWAFPHGRKQIWIERSGNSFKFGEHLNGENRLIEEVTGANALFLSAAAQLRHSQLWPVYSWFIDIQTMSISRWHGMESARGNDWLWSALERVTAGRSQLSLFPGLVKEEDEKFEAFRNLLCVADIGVTDIRLDDQALGSGVPMYERRRVRRVSLRHGSVAADTWLPLEEESEGTKVLFRGGPQIIEALWRGGVLVVDELEASLHPLLALKIVQQFNDPRTNPNNAQILFTTHDTNLLGTTLGEAALRRDQVWLTEKDQDGATCLYPLTDFKPRKTENLERGYLQGRYGAIPFLGELARVGA